MLLEYLNLMQLQQQVCHKLLTTSLDGTTVNSVAWLVSDGQAYLAAGGDGTNQLNIFEFWMRCDKECCRKII